MFPSTWNLRLKWPTPLWKMPTLTNVWTVTVITNRKSTTRFPTSYRWSTYWVRKSACRMWFESVLILMNNSSSTKLQRSLNVCASDMPASVHRSDRAARRRTALIACRGQSRMTGHDCTTTGSVWPSSCRRTALSSASCVELRTSQWVSVDVFSWRATSVWRSIGRRGGVVVDNSRDS